MNINDYEDYKNLENEFSKLKSRFNEIYNENNELRFYNDKIHSYLSNTKLVLNDIDFNIIESYVRETKLNRINEKR